jgi:hypothetical protein
MKIGNFEKIDAHGECRMENGQILINSLNKNAFEFTIFLISSNIL